MENQFSPEKGVEVALVEVLALRELRLRSAGGTEVDNCQGIAPLHAALLLAAGSSATILPAFLVKS